MPEKTKLTKQEIEAVAAKLDAFAETLPDQERDVLGWILTRAEAAQSAATPSAPAPREALLPGFNTSMASQLARSAGFGPNAGTTEVTWGYKFGAERLVRRDIFERGIADRLRPRGPGG